MTELTPGSAFAAVSEVTTRVTDQWKQHALRTGADRILLANYGSEGDEIEPVFLQPGDDLTAAKAEIAGSDGRPGRVIEVQSWFVLISIERVTVSSSVTPVMHMIAS